MTGRPTSRPGLWRIFRWPLLMAVVSAVGLVAALLGDGVYDLISWTTLGAMVVVMAAAWWGWRRPPP